MSSVVIRNIVNPTTADTTPTDNLSKQVCKALDYKDSRFYWKVVNSNRIKVGDRAGGFNHKGYWVIRLNGKLYFEHHLVWLMEYGSLPSEQLDHINGDKTDNNIGNLRLVSNRENHLNMPLQRNNKSGVPGVHFAKDRGKYMAYIHDKKMVTLGYFEDFFEAVCCRKSAEVKYGYHNNHGRVV